jgi:F-type H+-transporting ATPase subunit delta
MTPRAAAARYARALFDVAVTDRLDLERAEQELVAFAGVLKANPSLGRVLTNPAVPAPRKAAVVRELLTRSSVLPQVGRLLTLLAERDRLMLLDDLIAAFQDRVMEHHQVVRAELTTAIELPADRVAVLREGLARATGRRVHLQTRVDPSIVGGAVTRIGSTVYDGSVTGQLQRLKERLLDTDDGRRTTDDGLYEHQS